jgi:hypothetical protein
MESTEPNLVTLSGLGDGTAEELFQAALTKVLENIEDPNTDAKAKRTISLDFVVTPDENRRTAKIAVACSTRLAGMKPLGTNIFIGRHEGRLAAAEQLRQEEMFPTPAPKPAVIEGGGNP